MDTRRNPLENKTDAELVAIAELAGSNPDATGISAESPIVEMIRRHKVSLSNANKSVTWLTRVIIALMVVQIGIAIASFL